jgi:hypothetical protein
MACPIAASPKPSHAICIAKKAETIGFMIASLAN